jgi:hypothetical protein
MFARVARWVPANGVLFVVLVVVATLLTDRPDDDATDAAVLAYYADHGNRVSEIVAFILIGLSAFCFLSFLGSLRGTLARAEGDPAPLSTVVATSGATFITLAVAGHAAGAAIAQTEEIFDNFTVNANTARLLQTLHFDLYVLSLFAAAALAWAFGVLVLYTRVFPTWLAAAGFVAGVAGILGFFLPWMGVVVLAWFLLVSLQLLWPERGSPRAEATR